MKATFHACIACTGEILGFSFNYTLSFKGHSKFPSFPFFPFLSVNLLFGFRFFLKGSPEVLRHQPSIFSFNSEQLTVFFEDVVFNSVPKNKITPFLNLDQASLKCS